MTAAEFRADCRRDAEQFYLTHSIEQVIDHMAELMARNAGLAQSLELANQRAETEPRFMEQIAFALLRYHGGELLVPWGDLRRAGKLFHEIEEGDLLHIACEEAALTNEPQPPCSDHH
jgi:hypothetical protein